MSHRWSSEQRHCWRYCLSCGKMQAKNERTGEWVTLHSMRVADVKRTSTTCCNAHRG